MWVRVCVLREETACVSLAPQTFFFSSSHHVSLFEAGYFFGNILKTLSSVCALAGRRHPMQSVAPGRRESVSDVDVPDT